MGEKETQKAREILNRHYDYPSQKLAFKPCLDELSAALSTTWQPIETVPKDGTEVLLVWQWDSGLHTGTSVVLAAWRCRAHSHLSSDHDCPNEVGCDMNWDSYGGCMTHWMPLPDPPKNV